jgi:hypothetical protein
MKSKGLILTGGFIGLFNPGIDVKSARQSVFPLSLPRFVSGCRAQSLRREVRALITPFDAKSDAIIKDHLNSIGLTVTSDQRSKGEKPAPASI